jgi:hypothetical protein
MEFFGYHDFGVLHHAKIWLLAIVYTYYRFVPTKKQIIDYYGRKAMIKKVLLGLMWFLIICIVSYVGTGVILILVILGPETNQIKYEAAQMFRNTYIVPFAIGSLILTILGIATGILPGTKKKSQKKPRAKKKGSAKKKSRKKK